MASLQYSLPSQAPKDFPLELERVVVGREPSCTLQLNHPSISRQHCAVARKGEAFTVEDLHSSNGTFVNGRRVSGTFYLNDGDEIVIGDCKLRFALAAAAVAVADPEFAPTLLTRDPKAQEALKHAAPPPPPAPLPPTAPMPARPRLPPPPPSTPRPPVAPPPVPPAPPVVPPPLAAPASPFDAPTPKPMAPPPVPAVPPVSPVPALRPPAPPPIPAVPPPLPVGVAAPASQGNICPKCHRLNSPQARFCGSCGQTLTPPGAGVPAVAAPPPLPLPGAAIRPATVATPAAAGVVITGPMAYAGFWLRFAAVLLDGLILMVALVVFYIFLFILALVAGFILTAVPVLAPVVFGLGILIWAAFVIGMPWYYFAKQESSMQMATIGKRALGLQVVDLNGQRLSFGRATGRHFAKILSVIPLYLGFIMAGFTEKKQALHDILAGCLVIKKPPGA